MVDATVLIVGAGPAGLAASACFNKLNISNILLETEDCYAALWKKRTYDRVKLHLAKAFCQLPHMPFPPDAPKYVPKEGFVDYLDNYVLHSEIRPVYNRTAVSGFYNEKRAAWSIEVLNTSSNELEVYFGQFLVIATGENSDGFIPEIPGLDTFEGESIHSNKYVNARTYKDKQVLVVGCGNSGVEIAYDLSKWGARTFVIVRSPVHILTKGIVWLSMTLLKYRLPMNLVDKIAVTLEILVHGNLSKYGIERPKEGPFYLKTTTGRSATIDVGCVKKIKKGKIKKLCEMLAPGRGGHFNEDGHPKNKVPNHWKGQNGLYCIGFAGKGLLGIYNDALKVADDISSALSGRKKYN